MTAEMEKSNRIDRHAAEVFARLSPGDFVLVGGRSGHGKTRLGLGLAIEAVRAGREARFFSLAWNGNDVLALMREAGEEPAAYEGRFGFHVSDAIDAGYIISTLGASGRGTFVVVDYLQLLDADRKPDLMSQVRALKEFTDARGLVTIFTAQIDSSFDGSGFPGLGDVRLPNPVDLELFNKACFLRDGEVRFTAGG